MEKECKEDGFLFDSRIRILHMIVSHKLFSFEQAMEEVFRRLCSLERCVGLRSSHVSTNPGASFLFFFYFIRGVAGRKRESFPVRSMIDEEPVSMALFCIMRPGRTTFSCSFSTDLSHHLSSFSWETSHHVLLADWFSSDPLVS